MLAAESVVALVAGLVSPSLYTVSVLEIILPHALILGPIHVLVNTTAVRFVISPVSIVDVAVHVDKATLAMSPVLSPLATVLSSVVPGLLAKAISETSLPLTGVNGTSLESVGRAGLSRLIGVVTVFGHGLSGFFLGKVLAATQLLCSEKRY